MFEKVDAYQKVQLTDVELTHRDSVTPGGKRNVSLRAVRVRSSALVAERRLGSLLRVLEMRMR